MSREAFEAFMSREHGNMSLDIIGTGEYREWFVWRTWQAWQAARAAALEEAVEVADRHSTCANDTPSVIACSIRALKEKG